MPPQSIQIRLGQELRQRAADDLRPFDRDTLALLGVTLYPPELVGIELAGVTLFRERLGRRGAERHNEPLRYVLTHRRQRSAQR